MSQGARVPRVSGRLLVVGVVLAALAAVVFVPFDDLADRIRQRDTPDGEKKGLQLAVPTFPGKPTAEQAALLVQAVGFGGGVTGGAGGRVVHVSSAADSGPGSLREAVAGSKPKWVVFDRDLTIRLDRAIVVGSHTTIDGRGRTVVLTSAGRETTGLLVRSARNVVIESLTFRSFGALRPEGHKDHSKEVLVDGSVGVWIDHNDFSTGGDKVVAVQGSRGVTLSWNHVHDQREVFQIGRLARRAQSKITTVTVHHNFFDGVHFKAPDVSYATVHVFNNYYRDWDEVAVRSARQAQMLLERNVFDGLRPRVVGRFTAKTNVPAEGCNRARTYCDAAPGFLRAIGNRVSGVAGPVSRSPQRVFDAADTYPYDADRADDALVAAVVSGAGPTR